MEIEELKKKLKETEEGLTSALEDNEKIKKELDELKTEKETLIEEKTKLTSKVEELTTSEAGLKVDLEKTRSDYKELLNQKEKQTKKENTDEEVRLYENIGQIMKDIFD